MSLAIFFDWCRCSGTLKFVGHDTPEYAYALLCQVPSLGPEYAAPRRAFLQISSPNGQVFSNLTIGPITYNQFGYESAFQPATYDWNSPPRRPYLQPYQPQRPDGAGPAQPSASYPPYPLYVPAYEFQYEPSRPSRPHLTFDHTFQSRDHPPSFYRRTPTAEPRAYSPRTLGLQNEGYRISKRYARTPEPTTSRHRTMPVTSGSTNPQLVRTSTLRAPKMPRANNQLQPFSQYSHQRSNLRLVGDLAGMASNWTAEEKKEKRRLVEFERKQDGSTLTVTHKAVTIEDRAEDGICVNCIWWEENDEMFITSVDSLHLLELLVGNRFPVEEKNRIRRNLEGFKPRTITREDKNKKHLDKNDEETSNDAFFNVIMGFADPKPRNIEKDIKVFPWKLLPEMLKKILSKYVSCFMAGLHLPMLTLKFQSASYSSVRGKSASSRASEDDLDESPPDSDSSPERLGQPNDGRSNTTSRRSTPAAPRNRPLLRVQTSSPASSSSRLAPTSSYVSSEPVPTSSYVPSEPSPQARSFSSWEIEPQHQSPWLDQQTSFESSDVLGTPEVVSGAAESPRADTSHGDALRDYEHESSWHF